MTLQMESAEKEEGSCVETEIQIKRNTHYKESRRKENDVLI